MVRIHSRNPAEGPGEGFCTHEKCGMDRTECNGDLPKRHHSPADSSAWLGPSAHSNKRWKDLRGRICWDDEYRRWDSNPHSPRGTGF